MPKVYDRNNREIVVGDYINFLKNYYPVTEIQVNWNNEFEIHIDDGTEVPFSSRSSRFPNIKCSMSYTEYVQYLMEI